MKTLLIGLLGCAFHATPGLAQTSKFWRLEDRTVITDYRSVRSLAGDQTQLYIATDLGLLRYDHGFRRWEPALSYLDGYPAQSVLAALADPSDGSLWLGTRTGLFHYSYRTRQIDSLGVAGGVSDMMFDADRPFDGLFARTVRGWQFLPRGAFSTVPVRNLPGRVIAPASLAGVLRRYPSLDASRASLLVDARLRQSRYTAAFEFPNSEELALGTDGMGAFVFDPLTGRVEMLEYGLVGIGAGSVTITESGVLSGSSAPGGRSGFSRFDENLTRFESFEGPRATGYNFSVVRDLAVLDGRVWAATETGLMVTDLKGNHVVVDRELPDRNVLSLLADGDGLWVGTARGLARVDREMNVSDELGARGFQVFGMAAIRDSIWLATSAGLGAIARSGGRVGVPTDLTDVPGLTDPLTDVAAVGDTLVVATSDRKIMWVAADSWRTDTRAAIVGSILSLEADGDRVWIGGELGFAMLRLSDNFFVSFTAPHDVPGPVRDIAVSENYLWLATDGGVVRFAKRALR